MDLPSEIHPYCQRKRGLHNERLSTSTSVERDLVIMKVAVFSLVLWYFELFSFGVSMGSSAAGGILGGASGMKASAGASAAAGVLQRRWFLLAAALLSSSASGL